MKFILNKDNLTIENTKKINSGSVSYYEVDVEYDSSWNDLIIEAVIINKSTDEAVSRAVINNKIYIDKEMFEPTSIGFVGYTIDNDKKVYQISTDLKNMPMIKGAGDKNITIINSESIPEPTEWEIYVAQIQEIVDELQEGITQVENLNITAERVEDGVEVHITDKEGETTTSKVNDGENGADGADAKINGRNAIEIEAGENINIEPTVNGIEISARSGGATTNHAELTNLDYEHSGHTGFQPAGNYALKSEIPTKVSELTNDSGYTSNVGTITGITMNGTSKGTSGVVNLGTVITEHQDISGKQNITDNTLTTVNKTIPSAINEVNEIAKGANQALSYNNYQAMVTAFNSLDDDEYNVGQNVYVITTDVPDLWVSSVESTSSTYTYVDDATIVSALATNGYIQIGYYKLSMLETQKVDLTNYVDLTSTQTITGAKTFSSNITVPSIASSGNNTSLYLKTGSNTRMTIGAASIYTTCNLVPDPNNSKTLGTSSYKWKDLYLSGNLSDGTNSITVNKIANKDNFVTLTQTEYDNLQTKDPNTYYFIEEE